MGLRVAGHAPAIIFKLGEQAMHPSSTRRPINSKAETSHGRRWILGALALVTLAGIAPCGTTSAQTPAPAVKLYIFDLGQLKSANPQPLLDRGVTVTDMSVVAYLVVHPAERCCGFRNHSGRTRQARRHHRRPRHRQEDARGQLAEIGYKPVDVIYGDCRQLSLSTGL